MLSMSKLILVHLPLNYTLNGILFLRLDKQFLFYYDHEGYFK